MEENIVVKKSIAFAFRIDQAYKYLSEDHQEYIISKRLLRSGTAIRTLIKESELVESNSDFIHKSSVALSEAIETSYWLLILKDTNFLREAELQSIQKDCDELIQLLVSIVKSTKNGNQYAK